MNGRKMKTKLKCFWCGRRYLDLVKHTRNIHPELTARRYCMDEAQSISKRIWKKIIKIKITESGGKIYTCGVDYTKKEGMAIFGWWDKKGVFHVKKMVKL